MADLRRFSPSEIYITKHDAWAVLEFFWPGNGLNQAELSDADVNFAQGLLLAQESPHFVNGLTARLFGPHKGRTEALRAHIEHGAASFSTIRSPELALQDSSCENCRSEAPTSGCIWAREKMRG